MLVSMADGEGERTKILDFGIAKLRQEQEQAKVGKLTQTGAMMGTAASFFFLPSGSPCHVGAA